MGRPGHGSQDKSSLIINEVFGTETNVNMTQYGKVVTLDLPLFQSHKVTTDLFLVNFCSKFLKTPPSLPSTQHSKKRKYDGLTKKISSLNVSLYEIHCIVAGESNINEADGWSTFLKCWLLARGPVHNPQNKIILSN